MSKPEKRFRCGSIAASIWAEAKRINNEMVTLYSIKIDKPYKDREVWKHTGSFAAEDLPKVALVANEAYKYIRLNTSQPGDSVE